MNDIFECQISRNQKIIKKNLKIQVVYVKVCDIYTLLIYAYILMNK